ncbi:MAG: sugar ABC transporter permease [Chloroflexi bacterium]|nr:sugar ABC transporter permease [Chloroflexota bacterium]
MDVSAQARLENLLWAIGTAAFIVIGSVLVGQAAKMIARWRGLSTSDQRKVFWGFLFAAPWIIGFVIFVLGPALASLYYSFTDYKLGKEMNWTGLENYRELLLGAGAQGRRFSQAMFNSFYYMAVGVPLQIITSLGMAMLLNNQLRGIRLFRLIFYLPVILAGGPAALLAWRYMLAGNGGFINVTLQNLADSFFLFDWLYRGFIFTVEAFNSFYAGIAGGDPIGPFKYAVPALIGALVLLSIARGEWTPAKRARAWLVAELIGATIIVLLAARALVADPLDPGLLLGSGALAAAGAFIAHMRGETRRFHLWTLIPLALAAVGIVILMTFGSDAERSLYVLALLAAAAPLVLVYITRTPMKKRRLLGAGAALLTGIIIVRLIPGQLDGGRLAVLPQYLTLQSAIAQPDNLDYLNEGFAATTPAALWLYGLVALVLGGLSLADNRYPRTARTIALVSLAAFGLIAVSAAIDGVRYFQAYNQIAAATGEQNYHFAQFNAATAQWPDKNRVPLWMTNELWSKPSLILITMWSSGAGMLIFLAALKGVPRAFYEAAEVDGANRWQKFWKITLPMISPAMFYNVVIGVIAALQTFDTIYILRTPQTEDDLASAAFFLFNRTFRQLEIGQGAAVSWILAGIIVLLTVLQFRYNKWVYYEA